MIMIIINAQVSQRKLSTDFVRKLSAISVASDVSCISGRFVYIYFYHDDDNNVDHV